MLNKLRTRLILLILGGTIFSIVLVSIIANITLFNKFDLYMRHEQEHRLREIIKLVEQSYIQNEGWTEKTLENIRVSPLINNFDIEIKDQKNNIIFTQNMDNSMIRLHHDMMQRMEHNMLGSHYNMMGNLRNENYITEQYEIKYKNENIGIVTLGHIGPFLVSEREIEFTKGINASIFYGAVISIFVSILLGLYSSAIFSMPILKITEAANRIREGRLNTKIEIPNSVLELQDLTRSINHLSSSLSHQETLRKRLTSDISHELRTPLTILQTHIEAITDGVWEPTQDKLNTCRDEVLRLIKLVDELRHLTDIENYNLSLDINQYSFSEDLQIQIQNFFNPFQLKGVELITDIQEDILIKGDRDKIRQGIINLLSNALKFTTEGGIVIVRPIPAPPIFLFLDKSPL